MRCWLAKEKLEFLMNQKNQNLNKTFKRDKKSTQLENIADIIEVIKSRKKSKNLKSRIFDKKSTKGSINKYIKRDKGSLS